MRKTKIICTMGPATDREGILEQLIENGMDVARLNFSHGSYEEHGKRLDRLYELRRKCGRSVAALLDTKGPEIRTMEFTENKVMLKKGQTFTLYGEQKLGDASGVSITYDALWQDVEKGTKILIDDGLVELSLIHI